MPFTISKSKECPDSKPWAVTKKGANGPEGKTLGCHPSRAAASKQIGAIESEEGRRKGMSIEPVEEGWEVWADGELLGVFSDQAEAFALLSEHMTPVTSERAFRLLFREGEPTVDRRSINLGAVRFDRPFPLPLMFTKVTGQGHMGATFVGVIDGAERTGDTIVGRGRFDDPEHNPDAAEAVRLLEAGMLSTWSPDIGDASGEVSCVELGADGECARMIEVLTDGVLMGGTIVPFQALDSARIELDAGEPIVIEASATDLTKIHYVTTASSTGNPAEWIMRVSEDGTPAERKAALRIFRAAVVGAAPPMDWFNVPEPDKITPLTITEDGRVYGHLADWNRCHTGIRDRCVLAPRSKIDYAAFHQGHVLTAEGETIRTGNLTIFGGHPADGYAPAEVAKEHYDEAGTIWAQVRATNGKHGVWTCGSVLQGVGADTLARARACALSGDWRPIEGIGLELVAALSVPFPGFPLVASAMPEMLRLRAAFKGEECVSLVAAGVITPPDPMGALAARIEALEARLAAVEPVVDTFAPDALSRWEGEVLRS